MLSHTIGACKLLLHFLAREHLSSYLLLIFSFTKRAAVENLQGSLPRTVVHIETFGKCHTLQKFLRWNGSTEVGEVWLMGGRPTPLRGKLTIRGLDREYRSREKRVS